MSEILDRLMKGVSFGKAPLSYDQEKELAGHQDAKVRRKLAARHDIRPEILYYLAEDTVPEVRREIATNVKTPRQADMLLAKDSEGDVRCDLAGKIGKLVPGLSEDDSDRLTCLTIEVLEILVRDQLPRVRAVLAETLKDVTNAPHRIILHLARDTELEVAGPVLRCSPLLSDTDLMEIIQSGPLQGVLIEISRRFGLGEGVCDAIATTDKTAAIAAMLANKSAQIREETCDSLVEKARERESWQEPLARRPNLSLDAARKLAEFAADSLLEVMRSNDDLDPETLGMVSREVHRRLEETPEETARRTASATTSQQARQETERAQQLHDEGKLDAKAVAKALKKKEHGFVASALAVLTGLPREVVARIVESQSAKAVVALMRQAGLDMGLAARVQRDMCAIPAAAVVAPKGGKKAPCPLDEAECQAQLDYFRDSVLSPMPGEEGDKIYDPDWSAGERKESGPVDLDWEESGAKKAKAAIVEPDWAKEDEEDDDEEEIGPEDISSRELATKLHGEGRLTEKIIISAINMGDHVFVRTSLILLSGHDGKDVRRILASKDSFVITALVWKTGLSMSLASVVQSRVVQIPRNETLPLSSSGGFPMSEKEMKHRLDAFLDL
ncbi:MAG: DUF2336 domain-containing protein [Alphaproteobacteria bacterium]|nr:DUF2336 domain-containing protein [Alphaproteobacteria bacterium]